MADSRFTPAQRKAGQIATQKEAIDPGKIYILGVFGSTQKMSAMIREPFRGTRTVKVGDNTSLGPIRAIDSKGLLIEQNGEARRLPILK